MFICAPYGSPSQKITPPGSKRNVLSISPRFLKLYIPSKAIKSPHMANEPAVSISRSKLPAPRPRKKLFVSGSTTISTSASGVTSNSKFNCRPFTVLNCAVSGSSSVCLSTKLMNDTSPILVSY